MKLFITSVLIVFITIFLSGCFFLPEKKQYEVQIPKGSFYHSMGGWDYQRIPLIKPYDAISVDYKELGWLIKSKNESDSYLDSNFIKKIDVKNAIIYVYNDGLEIFGKFESPYYKGEEYPEVWIIIEPNEKKEVGFTTEKDFLQYIEENNLEIPKFRDINDVYEELKERGVLNWFPDEYETDDAIDPFNSVKPTKTSEEMGFQQKDCKYYEPPDERRGEKEGKWLDMPC